MIKIIKIKIDRFRSIMNMELEIESDYNVISFCGQNNVGKTNTLRAINLFFNPDQYERIIDMPTIKKATSGAATHPKITITFYDDKNDFYYELTRNIAEQEQEQYSLSGSKYKKAGSQKRNNKKLKNDEIDIVMNKFEFVYIESINVILPELIKSITDEVIDARYNKARFSESKKKLKESYDAYIDGLTEILGDFANDISETFKEFQPSWSVRFDVPKNSDSFRELISNDVSLKLDDNGSIGIEDKGAGLQRLAAILLQFEMLTRKNGKKQSIVCIDEPDVYIHEGLQRKLKDFLDIKSENAQIFLTTHSKVFLNQYNMKNVFLLEAKQRTQYSSRRKKDISVIETNMVDIKQDEGYKKICAHLGIEIQTYEPLKEYNIIVEGLCDKKYITELCRFFNLNVPNIISLDGANNADKYLNFFNSFYHKNENNKPKVKVLLDNDDKGREVFNNIKVSKYNNLEVQKMLSRNFAGKPLDKIDKNTNHEIEDLMYPEIICWLINEILKKRNMILIDEGKVCNKIEKAAFISVGILSLCENEKNENNPDNGNCIKFFPSSETGFKKSMAELFNIEANISLIKTLEECDKKHPFVHEYISELVSF